MIILDGGLTGNKNVAISEPRGRGPNHIGEPGGGIRIALDAQVLAANHVGQQHGFGAREIAGKGHAGGQFAAAISVVGVLPSAH